MPNSLFAELGAKTEDQSDILALLEARFPRGSSSESGWQLFEAEKEQPSLIFQHNKHGRVVDIKPGPALTPAARRELLAHIASSRAYETRQITRTTLYAPVPVRGAHRVDDDLQLLAYTGDIPPFQRMLFNFCYPLLVEIGFRGDPPDSAFSPRKMRAEREIALFLAGILQVVIPTRSARTVWTRPFNQQGPIAFADLDIPKRSTALLERFSEEVGAMPLREADGYYSEPLPMVDDVFALPGDLTNAWRQFKSLRGAERDQFLFACYWVNEARRSCTASPSAGLVAAVTALESLGNAVDLPVCECCGQIRGATARFRNTLDVLAPGSGKVASDLYSFRSTYAHGSGLAGLDHVGHRISMEQHYDWSRATNATLFCQTALRRWLDPEVRGALVGTT